MLLYCGCNNNHSFVVVGVSDLMSDVQTAGNFETPFSIRARANGKSGILVCALSEVRGLSIVLPARNLVRVIFERCSTQ